MVGACGVVVGAALMSGCYSYVPVERPTPGSVVRVELPVYSTVAGTRREEDVAEMEGTVVTAATDSLVLRVESLSQIGNFREIRSVDTLRVARADLSALSEKTFSKPKTIGLTVLIGAAVVGLAVAALDVGGGSQGGTDPPDGTTTSIRVKPVLSALLHALGR